MLDLQLSFVDQSKLRARDHVHSLTQ